MSTTLKGSRVAWLQEMGVAWAPVLTPMEPAVPLAPAPPPVTAPAPAVVGKGVAPPAREALTVCAPGDWAGLRRAVQSCQGCALFQSRRQAVVGVGHERAHWMVVGEAPGEQEDARGEPFVGAAGQLLDRMLAALGLGRSEGPPHQQVYITNTLKCRPPQNRNPQPEELQACNGFLEQQLAWVQPKVVMALGRFAAHQLLGTTAPLGQLRGQVHRRGEVPVVVSYHPAYLLRNPIDKRKAWDDWCLAMDTVKGPSSSAVSSR